MLDIRFIRAKICEIRGNLNRSSFASLILMY